MIRGGSPFESDEQLGKVYDARLVRRLLRYIAPHRRLVFLAMGFMLISTAVDLLTPYLLKTGIDRYLARLFLVYEGDPALCDSLRATVPPGQRFLDGGPGVLLIHPSGRGGVDGALRRRLEGRGLLRPEGHYLFPATERLGEVGQVRGDYWLVPEGRLDAVPPAVLVRVRGADLQGVTRLALLLGALLVVGLLVGYGHVLSLSIAGQRAMYDLRTSLFRHLQSLSLSYFDRNPQGRLVTRVTNDIEALNEMFTAVLVNLVKDVLLLSGTIGILLWMNSRLALTALLVIPAIAGISVFFRSRVRGAYRNVRRLLAALNAGLAEDVSGVKVIQAFGREAARRALYRETNDAYFRANIRQLVIFGVFRPAVELCASVGVALVLVYGGFGVLGGTLTLGALVAFLTYVRGMFQPVADMSEKYNIMQGAMAASERIFTILDTQPSVVEGAEIRSAATVDSPSGLDSSAALPTRAATRTPPLAPEPPVMPGRVEFRAVSFAYTPGSPVLREVSFTVEPGRSVALVGPTGAGKTSILSLLCRFYDPEAGEILLDGVDLRALPFAALRRHVAIVLQDAFIFSRSVRENITLGAPMSDAEVHRAAEMVQALDLIERLPQGFDTVMAERGATLSTGQKQLICFARALAHDPRVLILDEATSNVDPDTERRIQHAIDTLMRGRTSIVVAHRLSTIQKSDEILVLDGGRILERGDHRALLARRGIYHNLHLLQYRPA